MTILLVFQTFQGEVRLLAAKFQLPNKDRKDSQGICFLGKVSTITCRKKIVLSPELLNYCQLSLIMGVAFLVKD